MAWRNQPGCRSNMGVLPALFALYPPNSSPPLWDFTSCLHPWHTIDGPINHPGSTERLNTTLDIHWCVGCVHFGLQVTLFMAKSRLDSIHKNCTSDEFMLIKHDHYITFGWIRFNLMNLVSHCSVLRNVSFRNTSHMYQVSWPNLLPIQLNPSPLSSLCLPLHTNFHIQWWTFQAHPCIAHPPFGSWMLIVFGIISEMVVPLWFQTYAHMCLLLSLL